MRVTLVVVAALAVNTVLRNRSAAVRHWVLAMALICAGLTPLLGMVLPEWHPVMDQRVSGSASERATGPSVTTSVMFSIPQDKAPAKAQSAISLDRALRVAWVAGSALILLTLLVGFCRLAWLAAHARRVIDHRWAQLMGTVTLLQSGHP